MENKNYIMRNSTHYLNNGKIAQDHIIKSTPIKSNKIKNINGTNGKLFTQEFAVAIKKNSINKSSLNKNQNNTKRS